MFMTLLLMSWMSDGLPRSRKRRSRKAPLQHEHAGHRYRPCGEYRGHTCPRPEIARLPRQESAPYCKQRPEQIALVDIADGRFRQRDSIRHALQVADISGQRR